MRWHKTQRLLWGTFFLLISCGYHFAGSGRFPAGVERIYITMLENRSSETGAERLFTNDLIYEFTRNRESAIADSQDAADAILRGTIQRIAVATISRSSVSTAIERRVTATVALRLERPDGRLIWSSGNLVEKEAYEVDSENKTATDQSKSDAIAEVSQRIAESAFNRLTDQF